MSVIAEGMFGGHRESLSPRPGGQGYFYGADPTLTLFEGCFLEHFRNRRAFHAFSHDVMITILDYSGDFSGYAFVQFVDQFLSLLFRQQKAHFTYLKQFRLE
jgi:hypothetical protein